MVVLPFGPSMCKHKMHSVLGTERFERDHLKNLLLQRVIFQHAGNWFGLGYKHNNSWLGLMKVADYQPQGLKTISWLAWWIPFFFFFFFPKSLPLWEELKHLLMRSALYLRRNNIQWELVGLELDLQEGRARVCIRGGRNPILKGPHQNTTTEKTRQAAPITTPQMCA